MRTYIAPIGHGLGDLIVSLPAIQWLIAAGDETWLVLRSPRQEGFEGLIDGLAGSVREADFAFDQASQANTRYFNLREHPLQTDHVWGSIEFETKYPGYKIADIVRGICHDWGILADFETLKQLPFDRDIAGRYRNTVFFVPGSDGTFKCWHRDRWLELAKTIELDYQCDVKILGQPERSQAVAELLHCGMSWLPTPDLHDALNVLSLCFGVVSVDTGLMHLALQQGVPTVGMWINNPGSLNYLRTVRHCFPVISPRCDPQCVSEELDKELNLVTEFRSWHGYDSWQCHAPENLRCMNRITVEQVYSQFRQAAAIAAATAEDNVAAFPSVQ